MNLGCFSNFETAMITREARRTCYGDIETSTECEYGMCVTALQPPSKSNVGYATTPLRVKPNEILSDLMIIRQSLDHKVTQPSQLPSTPNGLQASVELLRLFWSVEET